MGVAEAARSFNANLICFDGGVLAPAGSPEATANRLYDLVSAEALDGLVIWSSALDWNVDEAVTEAFCRRFAALSVVSVGRAFPGIPSVLVDNYQGMRDALTHLIRDHHYRRIAFLRGPEGAREEELRFRAYCDILAEHGIPFRAELVSGRTNWVRSDGLVAVQDFLDVRGLRPGADFEAIVSVGDDMACGALETLRDRGIRVPDDVAVVGFNDDDEGRAIVPALTTVRQPVGDMSRAAMAALMALLDGGTPLETVTLPLELIVRRSCGCLSPGVIQAAAPSTAIQGAQTPAAPDLEALAGQMAQGLAVDAAEASSLVSAFLNDATGDSTAAFLAMLNTALQRDALAGRDAGLWQGALSVLRAGLLPGLPAGTLAKAENLWQQARVLAGETATQARTYQRFRAEMDTRLLSDFSQRIQTASGREALLETLAADLPALGVSACYLALYENPQEPTGQAGLWFAFDARGRLTLDADACHFPARRLLPPGLLDPTEPHRLVVLPLYFHDRHLGFLALETDTRGAAFSETFRKQISTALEGLFLREEIRRAWQQAEAANQLKSKFLATVSHELRTPLSLIVGTIEMMLRAEAEEGPALPPLYRKDLDSIHASAQHLARLIGDVLDLASSQAGELRLVREPLRLSDVLTKVAVLGEPLARERGLDWKTDIPDGLPLVWGDRTRLQQVALNLVSNAVKFTEQGFVSLWVEVGRQEVLVAVSDTGMGIPSGEQEVIFDEFRQSERATRRGYGGMGLGLAISKRIIELHGGRIGVLSTGGDGAGSTFYFTLPVLAEQPPQPTTAEDRSDTVFLLTERAGQAQRLADHLTGRGFKVAVLPVAEHPDWLTQIVSAPPGAVVLDYEPAAERGWELMHLLKLNPATGDIPVLFYTLSETGAAGSVLALDYLAKPVDSDVLAAALARQGLERDNSPAKTVLIVDDDPAILDLHARIVQASVPRCRLLRASNGAQALEMMSQTRPDLVLLDLMMPEMDGFAVLERMREQRSLRDVPVIVLTAQILTHPDMARLQKGVAAVLGKGLFTEAEVLSQVEAVLAHGKRLGSDAQRVVRQAMAYIHEHYAEPISRDELAQHLAVNERHLTRCFRQELGVTPIAYLNRYRIRQARALLEQGAASITDVALATGFSDSNYFGRVFQREVGVSPGAYRRGERAPAPG